MGGTGSDGLPSTAGAAPAVAPMSRECVGATGTGPTIPSSAAQPERRNASDAQRDGRRLAELPCCRRRCGGNRGRAGPWPSFSVLARGALLAWGRGCGSCLAARSRAEGGGWSRVVGDAAPAGLGRHDSGAGSPGHGCEPNSPSRCERRAVPGRSEERCGHAAREAGRFQEPTAHRIGDVEGGVLVDHLVDDVLLAQIVPTRRLPCRVPVDVVLALHPATETELRLRAEASSSVSAGRVR